ncbi:MAG: SPOR domain-containing protein [Psychroflexus sp.]
MRVEEYIKQLLYRYDCVIVPEFGAFIIQKKTSKYYSHVHKFTPPSRKITFNKAIQNHDGLLAEAIAKGESMDFESAKQKIQNFVDDFGSALKADKMIEIPELGQFNLNEEDKLSFEPNQNINFFTDSFGLEEFTIDKISETEHIQEPIVDEKIKTLSPLQENSEERRRRPYLKYAAVGIIAIGIAGFAGIYQYNNYIISYNDSEAQKAESLLQERIQSAEFNYTLTELPLDATQIETVKPKYHVVAGAYRVESNASKKVELLREKGYEASMIGKNTYGLYQVAFASFVDRGKALAQLRKIKAIENPDAWLFVKQF